MPETRKHAAIMFTDIVGYTRLMGSDEDKAVDILSRNRSIHQSCIEKSKGTII
jgi:class 3 adenylate cyclase